MELHTNQVQKSRQNLLSIEVQHVDSLIVLVRVVEAAYLPTLQNLSKIYRKSKGLEFTSDLYDSSRGVERILKDFELIRIGRQSGQI